MHHTYYLDHWRRMRLTERCYACLGLAGVLVALAALVVIAAVGGSGRSWGIFGAGMGVAFSGLTEALPPGAVRRRLFRRPEAAPAPDVQPAPEPAPAAGPQAAEAESSGSSADWLFCVICREQGLPDIDRPDHYILPEGWLNVTVARRYADDLDWVYCSEAHLREHLARPLPPPVPEEEESDDPFRPRTAYDRVQDFVWLTLFCVAVLLFLAGCGTGLWGLGRLIAHL